MANLIIRENGVERTIPASHGEEITVQTPCDCSAVTGVQIAGVVYPFYDAAGNSLADVTGLFAENVLIRVLIDTVNTRATIINPAITSQGIGALPLSGGTMTGPITMPTLPDLKFAAATGGQNKSPTYFATFNGNNITKGLAYSTLEDVKSAVLPTPETWTFTLEDGSTVTKAVYVG